MPIDNLKDAEKTYDLSSLASEIPSEGLFNQCDTEDEDATAFGSDPNTNPCHNVTAIASEDESGLHPYVVSPEQYSDLQTLTDM